MKKMKLSNFPVKCPICNNFVPELGINTHLDSGCKINIVPNPNKVNGDDIIKKPVHNNTSNDIETINSYYSKQTSNHIFIGNNSVEKPKKTFQSTLFSNNSIRRKSEESSFSKSPNHINNNGMNFGSKKLNENSYLNKNILSNIGQNSNSNQSHSNSNVIENMNEKDEKTKRRREINKQLPLAELVRPKTIDEFYGQEELVGENSILKSLIMENRIPSLIFWGPPGVGKTCLARIIANNCDTFYKEISGTSHGVADMKKASEECANYHRITGKKPIFFVDEIHRFNKLQQDFFLPAVERGDYILIGATTENPSFKVNAALLSRCRVFTLKKIESKNMVNILKRAAKIKLELNDKNLIINSKNSQNEKIEESPCNDVNIEESPNKKIKIEESSNKKIKIEESPGKEIKIDESPRKKIKIEDSFIENNEYSPMEDKINNLENSNEDLVENKETNETKDNTIIINEEVLELISIMSDGDARTALNILDMATDSILASKKKIMSKEIIKKAFQKTHLLYDRNGEEHYNLISAFHKSVRGSDDNATLYWLGRMIYAGEDPLYIARRMIRIASEDVGYADNYALTMATSCYQACQFIGMPECDVILAHTAVYLSRAPKSVEVYMGLHMVKDTIQSEIAYSVPFHLRNAPTKLMEDMGYSKGYKYNPEYEIPVEQEYLPKDLKCRRYLGVFEEERKRKYEESLMKQ